ncbi:2Fe-2S iron-sulfur cluster-binding protein [Spirochaetota bacterium]
MGTINIDGKKIKAKDGQTILQAARENGIDIPSLCWNDGVEPYGSCRLCIVEITKDGRSVIETACTYPAEEGISVKTETPILAESRKIALELHLARCPEVPVVVKLAKKYGIDKAPKEMELDSDGCTLCGLCIRACNDVVKAGAIQFTGNSSEKKVDSPFSKKADDCIACGSCAFICPCNFIEKKDIFGETSKRELVNWKVNLDLKGCKICGNPYAPEEHLEKIKQKHFLPKEFFEICPSCRTYPTVDEELCKGCGSCAECCPCGALELEDKGGAEKKSHVYTENCTACRSCEPHCPMRAIS